MNAITELTKNPKNLQDNGFILYIMMLYYVLLSDVLGSFKKQSLQIELTLDTK